MHDSSTCPECGRPLPADAVAELCPACLLAAALNHPAKHRRAVPHQRKRLLHYQLLKQIGEGGMGVVYKARDTRLGRMVAIKVLPSDKVDDPERRRRFIHEAKAASALNHPNIVTIYEVAVHAGVHFIVMEFIEGRTLDLLVGRTGLTPDQVLLYAIPIAGALARAHEAGIVHRDLKPQNIMVRDDGLVKLLDFGLAKLVEPEIAGDRGPEFVVPPLSGTSAPRHRLKAELRTQNDAALIESPPTLATRIAGTPGYMAPEQIEGRRVDGRADIFAFGAVLHHALSGKKPFARDSAEATFAAILNDEPAPLANVPSTLATVVARCLQKNPSDRFQTAAELQAALRSVSTAAGAERPEPSVAVLPFANLGGRAEDEFFGDALAGEIITALARIPGLKVIGRMSSRLVAGERLEPRVAGERLGVAHLLEGTVQRSESTLRIAARLLRAADGACLWADNYDRTPADVFAIQDEIAQAIAGRLRIAPKKRGPLVTRPTENLEAYHLYLLGRQAFELRAQNYLTEARDYYEQALRLDPGFTLAHAALAEIWWYLAFWGYVPPREAILHGVWAALRAQELDDQRPEAHALLGLFRELSDFKWNEVRREIDRARAIDPDLPLVRTAYMVAVLGPAGRFDEACAEAEAILRTDPYDFGARAWLIVWLQWSGRHDAAMTECRWIIAQEPRFPLSYQLLGWSLELTDQHDEALPALQKWVEFSGRSDHALSELAWLHARRGRTDEARRLLAELDERSRARYVPPTAQAVIYCALGEMEQAMEWTDRAIDARDTYVTFLKWASILLPLHAHPRYPQLLRKMNLEP